MFFLGGIFRRLETDDKCLILTRSARPPISAVHDREPIMLEIKQARAWLTDTDAAKNMLENDFFGKPDKNRLIIPTILLRRIKKPVELLLSIRQVFGTPSGTRTLDTLIKSQVLLYQLS